MFFLSLDFRGVSNFFIIFMIFYFSHIIAKNQKQRIYIVLNFLFLVLHKIDKIILYVFPVVWLRLVVCLIRWLLVWTRLLVPDYNIRCIKK